MQSEAAALRLRCFQGLLAHLGVRNAFKSFLVSASLFLPQGHWSMLAPLAVFKGSRSPTRHPRSKDQVASILVDVLESEVLCPAEDNRGTLTQEPMSGCFLNPKSSLVHPGQGCPQPVGLSFIDFFRQSLLLSNHEPSCCIFNYFSHSPLYTPRLELGSVFSLLFPPTT